MAEDDKIFIRIGRALRIADQLEDRAMELCSDPITGTLAMAAAEYTCMRRLAGRIDETNYTSEQMNAAIRLIIATCQLTDSLNHSAQLCEHLDDANDNPRRIQVRKVLMAVYRGELDLVGAVHLDSDNASDAGFHDGREPTEDSIQEILDRMRKE